MKEGENCELLKKGSKKYGGLWVIEARQDLVPSLSLHQTSQKTNQLTLMCSKTLVVLNICPSPFHLFLIVN